jgi:hypothetical protein
VARLALSAAALVADLGLLPPPQAVSHAPVDKAATSLRRSLSIITSPEHASPATRVISSDSRHS